MNKYLKISEVAQRLSVSKQMVTVMYRERQIPGIRFGKKAIRIPEVVVDAWVRTRARNTQMKAAMPHREMATRIYCECALHGHALDTETVEKLRQVATESLLSPDICYMCGLEFPRLPEDYEPGDIEALEGQELLHEMEYRSTEALADCARVLNDAYPCFEKTIEVKLRDTKGRVQEQAISCEVAAHLTRLPGRTATGSKRAARSVFLEYIDEHGCAYCRELRSVFCSMTVQQIRDILQELQSEGVLGSVLVDPPFDGEPNARMQRRYYFRRET